MGSKLKSYALYLLSRREYSAAELKSKLLAKKYPGFDPEANREVAIESLLKDLVAQNLLSDERFVENLVRTRINHGCGPLRIREELIHKYKIDEGIMEKYLRHDEDEWLRLAEKVLIKKFGTSQEVMPLEVIKRKKYLQYKGFDYSTINKIVN